MLGRRFRASLCVPVCHPIPNVDPTTRRDHNRRIFITTEVYRRSHSKEYYVKISEFGGNASGMVLVDGMAGGKCILVTRRFSK
jgi:hypothetical protein